MCHTSELQAPQGQPKPSLGLGASRPAAKPFPDWRSTWEDASRLASTNKCSSCPSEGLTVVGLLFDCKAEGPRMSQATAVVAALVALDVGAAVDGYGCCCCFVVVAKCSPSSCYLSYLLILVKMMTILLTVVVIIVVLVLVIAMVCLLMFMLLLLLPFLLTRAFLSSQY